MNTLIRIGLVAVAGAMLGAGRTMADGRVVLSAGLPAGVPNEVVNELGVPPDSADDLLWNKQPCEEGGDLVPVLAPDGHHVTWGEYSRVRGWASLRCGPRGTQVLIHLSGLIPRGVYSMWIFTFEEGVARPIGAGALGAPDGSQSVVRVSASGQATFAVHHPAGDLSAFGAVGPCFLNEFVVHLVGAYHLDGKLYGPAPAPMPPPFGRCYWVPHFAFALGH